MLNNSFIYTLIVLSCLLITSCSNSETNRPQEPQKPYPYNEENVYYKNSNAGITLAGTLTYPKKDGEFPAVILITGSGAQDRDATSADHRPFLVLADYLTRHGIAVLRSDDRGVGKSEGTYGVYTTTTNKDLVLDIFAAFNYLQSREEINENKIGLIGHSGGGLVGAMVAAELPVVAFIVSLAGPGLNGCETLCQQVNHVGKSLGINAELINKYQVMLKQSFKILQNTPQKENAHAELINKYQKFLLKMSDSDRITLEKIGFGCPKDPNKWGDALMMPAFNEFFMLDPKTILKQVKCPILVLNGEKDLQVIPDENLNAIEMALVEGSNPDYTIKRFPGLNHLFQECRTGSPIEYERIEETISPLVLEVIKDWIYKHVN